MRAQALEVQRLLEGKSEKELGVLVAADLDICSMVGCLNLEPALVKNLAARIESERFREETRGKDRWQFWFSVVTAFGTLAAIATSIAALRRKRP